MIPKAIQDKATALRRSSALPWLVGLLILGFLFWRVSFAGIWAALIEADLTVYLPLMALATLLWFWLDAGACRYLFSTFNTKLSAAEVRSLRGLTYLLTPVHWSLGRAGIVARLHQSRNVPLLEGTSTIALYQTLDVILLSSLGLLGLFVLPSSAMTRTLIPLLAASAFLPSAYLFIVASEWGADNTIAAKMRAFRLHHAHRALRLQDALHVFAWRLAYYGVVIGSYWLGARCFGLDLGWPLLTATVPIIQGIGALPISPAGLGTQQATMIYFLAGPTTEAQITALGLSMPILTILFRCVIGLFYLRRGDLRKTDPQAA